MDEETSLQFLASSRFWIQRVFVPMLVFIGVGGNVVTVMILTRRRMRCTTHIYLTALAIADLIYLLFVLILSFEHYPNIHQRKYELYWRFYGITHWICDAASSTSVWLTVSFTIERYIIVCHPLRGKVYCTEGRAKNIITLISLLCLITTASTTFEHQLTWKEDCIQEQCLDEGTQTNVTTLNWDDLGAQENDNDLDRSNKSERVIRTFSDNNGTCCPNSYTIKTEPTDLAKNVTYTLIISWFSSITFGLLPLVLIATFNSFLIAAVYQSMRTRKQMANVPEVSRMRNENRITILLIGIVVLFLVCQTPTASFLIYHALDEEDSDTVTRNIKLALGNIFNSLVTLNASCNFLMYCVLSANYRNTFKKVFCSRTLHRHDTSVAFSRHYTTKRRDSNAVANLKRNRSEYRTPRNLETQSLSSIPRSKSLMMRPIGKTRSTDLVV